ALVSLLSELAKTRTVYVSGIPDLQIPHENLEDPTKWPDLVPDGSIIVIDEVQRVWRPRGPGSKVPPDIAALETHRHRGLDFYVVTQSPRLIDSNVRGLCGRHIHLRDLGILGRFWYEWPECADQCATTWKNAPLKKRYRLPKGIFDKYKSASVHVKPIRSFPTMLLVMVLALLVVAFMSWKAYTMISSKISPPQVVQVKKEPGQLPTGESRAPAAHVSPVPEYDPTIFIPRQTNKPETAPAYDHLRVVAAMPMVSGGICLGQKCKCFTSQGTDSGLGSDECRDWMQHRPFNPYQNADNSKGSQSQTAPPPPVQATPPEPRLTADLSAGYSATLPTVKTPLY
ncbi:MAG: zonular occludens toxin domain-containing protein, partial [Rhodoferax sp.]|nr:zonular occludens toxin domain-containing protein [Rhodoferax sp.]